MVHATNAPAPVVAKQLGRPARHWNAGVWIRLALAVSPTIVFAILGYLQTH